MKYKRLIAVIIMILLSFSSFGCLGHNTSANVENSKISNITTSFSSNRETQKLNITEIFGDEWKNQTSWLVSYDYKGFSYRLISPDLFTTYHFLSSLMLFNRSIQHKEETLKWLNNLNKENFNINSSIGRIFEIYIGVHSLALLDANITSKRALINELLSYKNSDGSITEKPDDFAYAVTETYWALRALHDMGYNISAMNDTKEFLYKKWESIRITEENFVGVFYILQSLKLMGFPPSELPGYHRKMSDIKELKREYLNDSRKFDLYNIFALAYLFKKAGFLDNSTVDIMVSRLYDYQCPDGGFNFNGQNGIASDTYYAFMGFYYLGIVPNSIAFEFIYKHESPMGGFFPNTLKIVDTETFYHTVYTAYVLNSLNKTKVKRYLKGMRYQLQNAKYEDISSLYYYMKTWKLVNRALPLEDYKILRDVTVNLLEQFLRESMGNKEVDPYVLVPLLRLAKELNITLDNHTKMQLASQILSYKNPDGSFAPGGRLDNTVYSVLALHELGYNYHDRSTIEFIQDAQLPDGGFAFRTSKKIGEQSNMGATYLSVIALEIMGAEPKNKEKVIQWIKHCKGQYGGIGMFPNSNNVDETTTYWAIKVLEALGIQ